MEGERVAGGGNVEVELEAQALIYNHLLGKMDTFVLKSAMKLDVIDIMARHGGPITLPQLASALPVPCTNLPALTRILRYLSNTRIIVVEDGDSGSCLYSLSPPASKLLVSRRGEEEEDKRPSLAGYTKLAFDEDMTNLMHSLDLCVSNGGPSSAPTATTLFERVKGESLYAHLSKNTGRSVMFNEAMASMMCMTVPAVMRACGEVFTGVRTVVDVGGGKGHLAKAIAKEFPHVECTVLDLPHVVRDLHGHGHGVSYVAGDMFTSIPQADAITLMRVLHNWNNDRCLEILKRCKEALSTNKGTLIIVEVVMDEDGEHQLNHARLAMDIFMMAYTGGKERTIKEWKDLLLKAGFTKFKVKPIKVLEQVIEAQI